MSPIIPMRMISFRTRLKGIAEAASAADAGRQLFALNENRLLLVRYVIVP
jgi:hypothetical protein